MKFLRCKICMGEVDIIGNEHSINKKIKCRICEYSNSESISNKGTEVIIIRKKSFINGD